MQSLKRLACLSAILVASMRPASGQFSTTQPVAVDNRSGPNYHHVSAPSDFWSTATLDMATALESARLYPVFQLPMGAGYFDFELKGTITNWSGGPVISNTMVYWYASAIDSQPTLSIWDAAPKIFFTNPESSDSRAWNTSNPSLSIYEQLGAGAANSKIGQIIVIPSKIPGSNAWMYKGNQHLVWSYLRISATGPEKDALSNIVWHPIVPVDWRSTPINP